MAGDVVPGARVILLAGNVRFVDRYMESIISLLLVVLPKAQYLVLPGSDFAREDARVAGRIHIRSGERPPVSRRYFDLVRGNRLNLINLLRCVCCRVRWVRQTPFMSI